MLIIWDIKIKLNKMDLLCTEKIMGDYETDIMYHHHHLQNHHDHDNEPVHNDKVLETTTTLNGGVIVNTNSPTDSSLSQLSYALSMSENSSSNASLSSTSYAECHEMSIIQSQHNSSSTQILTSMSQPTQKQQTQFYATSIANQAVEMMDLENVVKVVMNTSGNEVHIAQHNHQSHRQYSHVPLRRPVEILNTATEDPTFLTDRCLETALKIDERRQRPLCSYFKTVQEDITPPMRKLVAEWMMEVSFELKFLNLINLINSMTNKV